VRLIARENGLCHLLSRPESMGLCFVGKRKGGFHSFLDSFSPIPVFRVIEEASGRALGTASGALTVGQNVRIPSLPSKMFVVSKDPDAGVLFVSSSRYVSNPLSQSNLRVWF
jgi:tRNA-specific 2-thiouridylase